MEIKNKHIHQVYLVKVDEIPMPKILLPGGIQAISSLFGFGKANVVQDQIGNAVVNFQFGGFRIEAHEIPIMGLVLEGRRILLDVDSDTPDADSVFQKLIEILRSISGRNDTDYLSPIVKAQESEIVAYIDFPADSLYPSQIGKFIAEQLQPATMSKLASSSINIDLISFLVEYTPVDRTLDDFKIGMDRKEFILAPRAGVPLKERIYYSKAPVDTATHIKLLQSIESLLHQ
jgi:hypothetical protein